MNTDKLNNAEVVTATELYEIAKNSNLVMSFERQTSSDDEGNYSMYYIIGKEYYRVDMNLFNF